jgi:hypothetical protein
MDLVPRPEESREEKRAEIAARLDSSLVLRRMLGRCERLYGQFLAGAHTMEHQCRSAI